MNLAVIGISHKTAPVRVREKFSFTQEQLKESLKKLKARDFICGVVILSTCNRMEIYVEVKDADLGIKQVIRFIGDTFLVNEQRLSRYFYTLKGEDALSHIFKVASGLDSQILGETQILGQVKSSWETALLTGATSGLLDGLFSQAINTGKEVRSLTEISQGNVSIGSAAIKMLEDKLGSIQDKSIMIIGTGKIGTLLCNHLKDKNIAGIFVSNRTYPKAYELALSCKGKAINFSQLKKELVSCDIVISATSSPHIILTYKTVLEIMRQRSKPLLIMDLALPRDVEPLVENISGVSLFSLDDLKSVVQENYCKRQKEALLAEEIIRKKVSSFMATQNRKEAGDLCLNQP